MPGASSARLPDSGQRTGTEVEPGIERGEHRPNRPGRLALAGLGQEQMLGPHGASHRLEGPRSKLAKIKWLEEPRGWAEL